MEHLFSPKSNGDLRSDAQQSQIIGGDADEDHTQIIGRDISPIPPRFGNPGRNGSHFCLICGLKFSLLWTKRHKFL